MDKKELVLFLKDNLSIMIDKEMERYGEVLKVRLYLGDEEIASDHIYVESDEY